MLLSKVSFVIQTQMVAESESCPSSICFDMNQN